MSKFLILIIFLAAFLRLYYVNSNPKAMYGDELTLVYDAYSISQTGRDQKGERFPLVFQLGAARPPGYVYATVPFAKVFGPTAFAARAVSILSGIGIVILVYFLTKQLINTKAAYSGAILTAISPWAISLSRGGFESNFALFLALLGFYVLINYSKKPFLLIISAIFFALSMQTYATYRLTIPLFIVFWILINYKAFGKFFRQTNKLLLFSSLAIFCLSILLSLYLMLSIGGRDRFSIDNRNPNMLS